MSVHMNTYTDICMELYMIVHMQMYMYKCVYIKYVYNDMPMITTARMTVTLYKLANFFSDVCADAYSTASTYTDGDEHGNGDT